MGGLIQKIFLHISRDISWENTENDVLNADGAKGTQ